MGSLEETLGRLNPDRRPRNPVLSMRLSDETNQALDRACEEWGLNRCSMARAILEHGLRELGILDPDGRKKSSGD